MKQRVPRSREKGCVRLVDTTEPPSQRVQRKAPVFLSGGGVSSSSPHLFKPGNEGSISNTKMMPPVAPRGWLGTWHRAECGEREPGLLLPTGVDLIPPPSGTGLSENSGCAGMCRERGRRAHPPHHLRSHRPGEHTPLSQASPCKGSGKIKQSAP